MYRGVFLSVLDTGSLAIKFGKRPYFIKLGTTAIVLRSWLSRCFLFSHISFFKKFYFGQTLEKYRELSSSFSNAQLLELAQQIFAKSHKEIWIQIESAKESGAERLICLLVHISRDHGVSLNLHFPPAIYGGLLHHHVIRALTQKFLLPHAQFSRQGASASQLTVIVKDLSFEVQDI